WFGFSSVTMNKTSSLISGNTSHMFGCIIARVEAFGLGNLGRRRDVVWTHVGVGSTARGQTPGISSIIEIGYDDRCKSEARREGEEE
ncbi:hypothetical protein K443DRAFT_91684, partial [Laccaria amethystina LaAM-08-1]